MKELKIKTALVLLSASLLVACTNNEKNAEKNNIPFANKQSEEVAETEEETTDDADKEEAKKQEAQEEENKNLPNEENVHDPNSIFVIVNRGEVLDASFEPNDLVPLEVESTNPIEAVNQLRKEANDALTTLFTEAAKSGHILYAVSGYRSYDYQEELFNNYIESYGEEEARRFSAPPGASEHQTGLAMDVTSEEVAYGLVETFGETKAGTWVKDNAHRFGYIIRYPEGKEDITGYMFEPWHLRYVGTELSYELYDSGLTYEEYLWDKGIDVKN